MAITVSIPFLKYFYEVARAGSVTEGARRLRISQPAVSKSLQSLEAELGTALFERRPRGIRLTSAGLVAFDYARQIFAQAEALQDHFSGGSATGSLRGTWCLGASDTLAIHALPSQMGDFKRAHPQLKISLFSGSSPQIKDELLKDRCDVGLFFTPLKRGEPFDAEVVGETEFWIVARPSFLTPRQVRQGLSALRKLPRIESRHLDYADGLPEHFHAHAVGLTEAPFLEVNNQEVKKSLAIQGYGYAFLIRESVQAEVASRELVRIPTPRPLQAPIYRVVRRDRPLSAASQAFFKIPAKKPSPFGAR